MSNENITRSKASIYFQAVRAFSFPASVVPCVLGAMLALLMEPQTISWWLMPFIILSLISLHAASNVTTDFDDYNRGVDREDTLGGSRVLVEKLLKPAEMLRFGLALFGAAIFFGLPIIIERGFVLLVLGFAGIIGGYFYTAKPFSFKYRALGDILIFLMYGPAIVGGTFYALTGHFTWTSVYVSVPVGFLIVGILQANNLRDIIHDRAANIKTLATIFGNGFAKGEYIFLIVGSYLTIAVLVLTNILSAWALIVLLSLPLAIKNLEALKGVTVENTSKIAMLDAQTAQLTLVFGVLQSLSLLIYKFTG